MPLVQQWQRGLELYSTGLLIILLIIV